MFSVLVFIVLFSNLSSLEVALRDNDKDDELLMVLVFHRHGERNLIRTYLNNPHKNVSFWQRRFPHLTDEGVQQQFDLGVYLRERYKDFLPAEYHHKDIYVRSTDVDRSIVSANVLLAGLYPPTGSEPWFKTIPSQLIPVHTRPRIEDPVIGQRKNCPKFNKLFKQLLNSTEITKINNENAELFANLTRTTGMEFKSIVEVDRLFHSLNEAFESGQELPEWTAAYYPQLDKIANFFYSLFGYTTQLARLKAGPFFNDIITNIKMKLQSKDNYYKFILYSGNKSALGNILAALGAFDEQFISNVYGHMLIELRRRGLKNYVTVEYYNTREVIKLGLKGCEADDCTLEEFEEALSPLVLNLEQWEEECKDTYTGPSILNRKVTYF